MSHAAGSNNWSASVEAIVQRAPKFVLDRDSLRAQLRLLALLGSAAPLVELLNSLAIFVESCAEGLYCSVLLVDASGQALRPGAAPRLPRAYVEAIDPVPIAIGRGCCGTAAARREMVIAEDVERSELWVGYAATAVSHGLRACWSVPILDDAGGTLGTLALYYGSPRKPSTQEVDLIQFAAFLAAFVIQRHRDAERLRTSDARLEAPVWGTELGLWEHTVGGEFRWFDSWCERLDLDPCVGPNSFEQWLARIHPDDLEGYRRAEGPAVLGKVDHYSVDYRVRTRGGRWRWVQERAKVVARSANGTAARYVGVCVDIDREKTTEAALRRAEERYELAINAARLPVWEFDVASDAVRGNVHWHQAAGYDLSEEQVSARTETWMSDVHPDDAQRHQRIYKEPSVDSAGFYETEFRLRQPNGSYKWLLDRGRVVERDATGGPLKVVGIALDIDARKRTESALRESEERFRSAFEAAAIGMALVRMDGRFLRVNPALCRIVGYSSEELLERDFKSITHPDDLEKHADLTAQTLAGARVYFDLEKRYVHKSGRTIWISLSVSLVRDEEGQPRHFFSQIQDITARKQAEMSLSESELRYRMTSALVPGFVFEAAIVAGAVRLTWASDGFERVYGCSPAEFQRLEHSRFYDPETRARRCAAYHAAARGEEVRLEYRLHSLDGQIKWLRVSAKRLPANDGLERVLGVAEDISEQVRLATALREATQQEQQRLGREIHDGLGQELTGLAYLAGSLARATTGSDAALAQDLATLESIANQSIKTCRDIARGISPLTESRGSLVQALRSLAEGVPTGGPMRVSFQATERAPLKLPWASRDHLYRIAQEATTNAIRHSGGDSIRMSIGVHSSFVRMEIDDNGRGLARRGATLSGLGIDSMRQRAAAIGATLSLHRSESGGVAVLCECPQPGLSADPGERQPLTDEGNSKPRRPPVPISS